LKCLLVHIAEDSLNYFPSMARANNAPVTSPEMAWEALRKLYPEYDQKEFNYKNTNWSRSIHSLLNSIF